jgi:hypothetical protein
LVLLTTTLGGLAIQAKDISKGKTPRDIDTNFFFAAMMQGGGMGIFGDFLFAKYNRFGQDPVVSALGPMVGLTSDTLRLFKGSFDRALDDGTGASWEKFKKDALKYTMRWQPVAIPKLWYTRLASERLVTDEFERMINPNYESDALRMKKRAKEEFGQDIWWDK